MTPSDFEDLVTIVCIVSGWCFILYALFNFDTRIGFIGIGICLLLLGSR
jgi:hypothetical protein